jgi:hypothetical protein
MPRTIDITNHRFGRLIALSTLDRDAKRQWRWFCRCDCGNTTVVRGSELRNGATKSCGCLRLEILDQCRTTHGMTKTAEYGIWKGMKERCYNATHKQYHRYGGRGITICDRWRNSFENFFADMGKRPSPKHSIDRENNDGNYEPGNCRWATMREQQNNRSSCSYITFEGRTKSLSAWCDLLGVPYARVQHRIYAGHTFVEAVTTGFNDFRSWERRERNDLGQFFGPALAAAYDRLPHSFIHNGEEVPQ